MTLMEPQSIATAWTAITAGVVCGGGILTLIVQNYYAGQATARAAQKVEAVAEKAATAADRVENVRVSVAEATQRAEEAVQANTKALDILKSEASESARHRAHEDAILDAIHTLVNSQRGSTLKMAAVLARRVATFTTNPEDIAIADSAERESYDHERKQALIDAAIKSVV